LESIAETQPNSSGFAEIDRFCRDEAEQSTMHWATVKIEGALNMVYHLFGRGCRLLILWIRLRRSVAGAEYARLNTGARITRGNSGNGALLTREIRAGREQKQPAKRSIDPRRDVRLQSRSFAPWNQSPRPLWLRP
jgi:hypothetical protein